MHEQNFTEKPEWSSHVSWMSVCVCVCMLHIQIRKSEQIFADIYFTSYKSTFNTNFIFTHFITMADFFHLQIKQTSPTANEYI